MSAERSRIDLVVRFCDDGETKFVASEFTEGEAVPGGVVPGMVGAQAGDGSGDASGIGAVLGFIGRVEEG